MVVDYGARVKLEQILRNKCIVYCIQSVMISSSMAQSSKDPSGMYLRMMMGIFLCLSSFMAICSGSVSPSSSTITGAHIAICRARVPSTRARSYWNVTIPQIVLSNFAQRTKNILMMEGLRKNCGRYKNSQTKYTPLLFKNPHFYFLTFHFSLSTRKSRRTLTP